MNHYKLHEFADMIGVSVKTLQRWDNDGKLKAHRSPTNRRYYTHKQYVDYIVFEDIGSGLNYNRKKWNKLLEDCMLGEIKTIIVAHRDRFIRFGYEWFEKFLRSNGVEIIVVNNEKLSPHDELVNDLISIIHVFSCRIYGLRKYKKQIKEDAEIVKGLQDGNRSN